MDKDFELKECNLNENEDIEGIIVGNASFFLHGEHSSMVSKNNLDSSPLTNEIIIYNKVNNGLPNYYNINCYDDLGQPGCEDMDLQDLMNFHKALGLFIKYELKRNNLQQQG